MKARKIIITLILIISVSSLLSAQKIYNPKADAKKDIANAVIQAQKENKHVLLQIGGNWCPWCIKLHQYLHSNKEINKLLNDKYVFVEINYSKENKNMDIMKSLAYPQRFGFPVLVVLDNKGNRIHTQNSVYLEKDKSYDSKRLTNFLKQWSVEALQDEKYIKGKR